MSILDKLSVPLKILGAFVSILIVIIGIRILFAIALPDMMTTFIGQILIILIQNIAFVMVAALFILLFDKNRLTPASLGLSFKKHTPLLFLTGGMLSLTFIVFVYILGVMAGVTGLTGISGDISSVSITLLTVLVITVFIGFGEEIFYRGYIQKTLMKYGAGVALAVASLIFMVSHIPTHMEPLYFASVFMLSLVMGYLFIVTGSLWASIGFHFFEDFMVLGVFGTGDSIIGTGTMFTFSLPENIVFAGVSMGSGLDMLAVIISVFMLALLYIFRGRIEKTANLATNTL